jgi:hypothetical protein
MEEIKFTGISTFFLFAIPAVLALAALWWLAFGQGVHYFRRELSQEARHNEIVGAKVLPKSPIQIHLSNHRDSPLIIDRAEIDGGDLWVYYKNTGQSNVSGLRLRWQLIAPDETILKASEGYIHIYSENDAPDELGPGQRGEAKYKLPSDPRAVKLDLKLSS